MYTCKKNTSDTDPGFIEIKDTAWVQCLASKITLASLKDLGMGGVHKSSGSQQAGRQCGDAWGETLQALCNAVSSHLPQDISYLCLQTQRFPNR